MVNKHIHRAYCVIRGADSLFLNISVALQRRQSPGALLKLASDRATESHGLSGQASANHKAAAEAGSHGFATYSAASDNKQQQQRQQDHVPQLLSQTIWAEVSYRVLSRFWSNYQPNIFAVYFIPILGPTASTHSFALCFADL